MRLARAALVLLAVATAAQAQTRTLVRCGRVIDGKAASPIERAVILVEGDRIVKVGARLEAPAGAGVIELEGATCLPGLIDAHTHLLLQGDPTPADYDEQVLKESVPYRTIRATVAARATLMNGFTTLRDLGTEGAMYADADVRAAIERGVVPGPRLLIATRAFSGTGMYPLQGYSWELKMPDGVQVVDGVDEVRRGVREQLRFGADWIKYYSDRRYYLKDGALHSRPNFSDEEAQAFVQEAHRLGRKVAAHAIGREGIESALKAGVDTIEHSDGLDEEMMDRMVRQGTYWCPTIYVGVFVAPARGGIWPQMVELERQAFVKALKKGVRIALGTDAGGFPWTDGQAKEPAYMVKYGMTPMQAIRSATVVASELLGREKDLGTLEPGKLADVIGVAGDPLADIEALGRVSFVMKGGVVVKKE